MRVELAKNAGFCFGVNRAVNTVYGELEKGSTPVYTYGPIIHNDEVIRDLDGKGVRVIQDAAELKAENAGTLIIRSHGVSKAVQTELEQTGSKVVDATCPFVKKIHNIVSRYSEEGYFAVVIGSREHPEVQGIVGWAPEGRYIVVSSEEEICSAKVDWKERLCIVAQTTFNLKKFYNLVEIIQKRHYNIHDNVEKIDNSVLVFNTICSATRERQESAGELSARVDAMIVIGGSNSSNTKKLYEICSENCLNTYFIQTKADLVHTDLSRFDYVGITAGASTPNNIIEEVQKYVRDEL